jgi:3-oxoadipate enol-lactonase
VLEHHIRGHGPTIVFVHGSTLDHRMWQPQVDALAGGYRTVTYDRRGHGRAPAPTGRYRHVDDLAAICDSLGGEVHVVAHSVGGLHALELALVRPVASLILIAMGGGTTVPFPPELIAMVGTLRAAAARDLAAARRMWSHTEFFAPARERPALAAALDRMLADYSGWHWRHEDPAEELTPPVATRLEEITAPALVVIGERDLPYNKAVAEELERRLPKVRRMDVPGVGHMASMEAPEAVTRAIREHVPR